MSNSLTKAKKKRQTPKIKTNNPNPDAWPFRGQVGSELYVPVLARIPILFKMLFFGRMQVRFDFYAAKQVKLGPAECNVYFGWPDFIENYKQKRYQKKIQKLADKHIGEVSTSNALEQSNIVPIRIDDEVRNTMENVVDEITERAAGVVRGRV
jgi:hypothetical protein